MAAGPSEAEVLVGELESRVDRLRALYEQYFLGFEKLEPLIPRKDVDRRFDAIRRLHFRNTALRFKFNMLQQRYNTFQMYWLRICRQIEEGTYQRHLNKAKKRAQQQQVEEENSRKSIDDGWNVDIDVTESPEDLFASFEAAQTKPPSKPPVFSIPPAAVTSLGVDDPFAMSMPPPPKVKSDIPALAAALRTPSPAKSPANVTPAGAFKPSIPPRIAPGSMVQGSEKKPVVLRKAEPTAPRTVAPDALNAPKTIIAPPMGSMLPGAASPPPPAHTPAAAFQPAPRPPTMVPGAGATIKAPPLVFTKVAKPAAASPAAAAPAHKPAAAPAPKEAAAPPSAPKAPPKPPPSSPKTAPKPSPVKAGAPRPPMPSAAKGAPLIRPKAPEPPRTQPAKPENAK
ncbi:MAG: hypothetical protein U0174_13465 [Polyangiaceae bacterium]